MSIWRNIPGLSRVAAALLAGAVVATATTAFAITSNKFKYSAPQKGFYGIHPMALSPQDDFAAQNFSIARDTGGAHMDGDGCYLTGVNLPQGARLINIRVFYRSNGSDPTNDLSVELYRHTLSVDGGDTPVLANIPDDDNIRKGVTIPITTSQIVNNKRYIYGFVVCLGPGTEFDGARIIYTYQRAGD